MRWVLWLLVPFQVVCTAFFIWDIAAGLVGFRTEPIAWEFREAIEIGAALGLVLGVVVGTWMLIASNRRARHMESRLRAASGAFAELLEDRFLEWNLTPAERDVAWFTMKGLSIGDIARLRNTSEGTVKAQSNAIYRKSGVSGRAQLLSLFIEEMLQGVEAKPAEAQVPAGSKPLRTESV